MATKKTQFLVGDGGWCVYTNPDLLDDAEVTIRFSPLVKPGRLVPVEVLVRWNAPDDQFPVYEITTMIPWELVEALANNPTTFDQIMNRMSLRTVMRLGRADPVLHADPKSLQVIAVMEATDAPKRRRKLKIPEGPGKYPDSFYEAYAVAYTSLAIEGEAPAVVLSEEHGVPRSTVHRWTKEARRRGFLKAGQRGKAG